MPFGKGAEEPRQRRQIARIEGKAIAPLLDQVRSAATAIGNQHRQAAGHSFIHHQPPLLNGACMNKRTGERVVSGKFAVLLETGEQNVFVQM